MALNIKNPEAERLAAEVAALSGESKTVAVLEALKERRARLLRERSGSRRLDEVRDFLEREVWSLPDVPGSDQTPEEDILGYSDCGA
jgi:antitoxin VapB